MGNWADKAVFYHIYPLGFCNAPAENGPKVEASHQILKIIDWIPHFKELGVTAIYFGPLFESVSHGYDTTDYYEIDKRLGSNEDFAQVCSKLHEADIKVVLDGVFNHVGRDFFAFKDLQARRENSSYKDWFQGVNFSGDSPYHDGFSYAEWEGCFNLVKLNLGNVAVRQYLLGAVAKWIKDYEIDGLRLDVAYCIEEGFLKALRSVTDKLTMDREEPFWLMGEIIHGDYKRLLGPGMLHSATNYECYKGIYSSHNDKNYYEINYSMNRLFARGGLYEGYCLYNFVDNHDVSRIISVLKEPRCIQNVYTLLFTMPGIPSIYYGSEWQVEGSKQQGDAALRPCLELEDMKDRDQGLIQHIQQLSELKKQYVALQAGCYEQVVVRNEQLIFARSCPKEKVYTALNLSDQPIQLSFSLEGESQWQDALGGGGKIEMKEGACLLTLQPFGSMVLVPKEKKVEVQESE